MACRLCGVASPFPTSRSKFLLSRAVGNLSGAIGTFEWDVTKCITYNPVTIEVFMRIVVGSIVVLALGASWRLTLQLKRIEETIESLRSEVDIHDDL